MDLITIKKLAYEHLGNKNSHHWKEKGNKYYHGERVATLVLELRKLILPEDDSHDEILTVTSWFHDIMNGNEDHATQGAKKAREVLQGYCTEAELDTICEIIAIHDDRTTGRDTYSDYIKLHQDADLLDHFGIFDIWMSFSYFVSHGKNMKDVMHWLSEVRPFEDAKYLSELNYEISRRIYKEKSDFVRSFSERFQVEGSGGIWNLENILLEDELDEKNR